MNFFVVRRANPRDLALTKLKKILCTKRKNRVGVFLHLWIPVHLRDISALIEILKVHACIKRPSIVDNLFSRGNVQGRGCCLEQQKMDHKRVHVESCSLGSRLHDESKECLECLVSLL